MAARRRPTSKKSTRKKSSGRRSRGASSSPAAEEARFQRQSDLRTLQEAERIRADSSRMSGARREAREQRRALDAIARNRRST